MMLRLALVLLVISGPVPAQEAAPEFAALLSKADALSRTAQLEAAEQAFERAFAAAGTEDQRAQALWLLANLRRSRGDATGAVETLARALELATERGWVANCLSQLGSLAPRAGRPDLAQQAYERLLALWGEDSPEAAPALLWLARTQRERGELEGAMRRLRAVLRSGEQSAAHTQARDLLVDCLLERGQREEALAVAREAQDDAWRARLLMLVAYAARDADDLQAADAIACEVLAMMPDHPQAMELRYALAAARGAVEDLMAELRARAGGPDSEQALRLLAYVAAAQGDTQTALGAWERIAALRRDDADAQATLGGMALDAGELERAEPALRRALALNPEHAGAADALAEVLVRRGRTDEAIELLKRASGYDPRDVNSARTLGHALGKYSLHHEAIAVYEQVRRETGQAEALAWEMARTRIALLQYDRAAEELLAALGGDEMPARMIGRELEALAADEIAAEQVLGVLDRRAEGELTDLERIAVGRAFLAGGRRERGLALLGSAASAGPELVQMAYESDLRGERELAGDLYALALRSHLEPAQAAEVAVRLAKIEAGRGRWREALAALEAAPVEDSPEALMLRVELLLQHARRPDRAGEVLAQLRARVGDHPAWQVALRWATAEWHFLSGRLDEAEAAYAELLAAQAGGAALGPIELPPLPPGTMALPGLPPQMALEPMAADAEPARAELRLAEIALRRGEVEAALQRMGVVAERWPDSDEANDALRWLAFARENLADRELPPAQDPAVRGYLTALALLDRGEFDEAEALLGEIIATRGEPLADDALMLRAEAQRLRGDAAGAAQSCLHVAERFPEGLLAPEALLCAARLLRDELDDVPEAAQVLRRIGEDYPDCAAAREARAELELLPAAPPAEASP
ncbi:MAG: tetratricopeptide repeat protein [Armatimonadota bacterium]